jgi:hypothetical protein
LLLLLVVLVVFCLFVWFFFLNEKGEGQIMMMLSENFGSIKFTYKLIFWGGVGGGGWRWRGADNDDAVSHFGSLNTF